MAGSIRNAMPPSQTEIAALLDYCDDGQIVERTLHLVAKRANGWVKFVRWYDGAVCVEPYRTKQYERLMAAWKAAGEDAIIESIRRKK